MAYRSMMHCVKDLEKHGQLVRIREEVDPELEVAAIHRRVYDQKGPALFFENIKGSPFPGVSNIYGTFERTEFIFRKTLARVQKVIELKADPTRFFHQPGRYWNAPFTALSALPRKVRLASPIKHGQTQISQLPQIKSWPMDGGAFITLPQVFTLPPGERSVMKSNLGMYRIQLSGNEYKQDQEIGLHYQLHRGIGVHHSQYNQSDEPFRVSIFVGGPPSHAFAAIMPLPEGLSELTFAGMLAGRRFRYQWDRNFVLSSDADFVITGIVEKNRKLPEGPFGDHLGYYSLQHDFPVMKVDRVYHRRNAVWHFTVVGRPPQEDSSFGYLIHQMVKELTTQEFPGVKEVNAVDAAGVHPLLLAIGSERYMPFREKRPEEILTQANHLLGKGQTSLAKYLIIADLEEEGAVSTHDEQAFFAYLLKRIDWQRDLHFYTQTTIDTLDYSGHGWNAGSKLVMACSGPQIRCLTSVLPKDFYLPDSFSNPHFFQSGILILQGPAFSDYDRAEHELSELIHHLERYDLSEIPLIVLADDSAFTAYNLNNFVWVTFTRSNPSHDIYGIRSFVDHKHWGCEGPLIIDARKKPHHAPELETMPEVEKKVDRFFQKGGDLEKWG